MASTLFKKLAFYSTKICKPTYSIILPTRLITTTTHLLGAQEETKHRLSVMDYYFKREERKDKETFMNLVDVYTKKKFKTGHVEFVYCAMRRMYDFGVHEDLEVYKKIINVMPKGKMIAENMFQAETLYYPKHQMAITDLMVQMEENDVWPDRDMQDLILSIFGDRSQPIKKYWRMMYWYPKFKNASPWLLPKPVPKDTLALTKLAMSRMCSVDLQTDIDVWQTKELEGDTEDTWICNGISPTQKKLLANHPIKYPIYLEGGFKIYLRKSAITYFVLRADMPPTRRKRTERDDDVIKNLRIPFFDYPDEDDLIPKLSVHEQKDGIIYAIAATGTSSRDSLLSWLKLLEKHVNPRIANIPIIFRSSSPLGHPDPVPGLESGNSIKLVGQE